MENTNAIREIVIEKIEKALREINKTYDMKFKLKESSLVIEDAKELLVIDDVKEPVKDKRDIRSNC